MSNAAILCTSCGAASETPLSQCAKCGGKNARVCAGCGFQNSLAKNYCDKCGNPISEIGAVIAPPPITAAPGAAKSEIPATVLKQIPRDPAAKKDAPAEPVAALPPAKKALQPGEAHGPPLPVAGRQFPDRFAAPPVTDPGGSWSASAPPTESRPPRWIGTLRRALTFAFVLTMVSASLLAFRYWSEHNKPENALLRDAAHYLEALRTRDYPAAYAQFSDAARKSSTLEEFVASRDTSTWTWSDLRIEHSDPSAMLVAYQLKIEGAEPRIDRVLFIEENKRWVRPYSWPLMRKVEEAFDKNDTDRGLVLAQAAATINPRDPMARGYLCEAAYYRKAAADTETQCLSAIQLARVYPSNLSLKSLYHLHAILADTYKNALHKPEFALDQFAQMLAFPSISPADQCEILLARSEAYMTLSRPGEALSDANRAGALCVRPQDLAYIDEIRSKLNAPIQ